MIAPGFFLYLGLSLLLGYFGREKKFGFIGNFLAAFLFTPLLGFVFYLLQSDVTSTEKKT